VRARTALINTARGLTKSYGERLRGCGPRKMNRELAQGLSPELQSALQPLLDEVESLSERIREYNERVQQIAQESYPEVARLERVKGVGALIALTYVLTLEDPRRFRKSRDVGCYVGLQPGRRNSGQSREHAIRTDEDGAPARSASSASGARSFCTPADESLHPQIRREGFSYLLRTVVRYNSRHFPSRRQFHELCRACAFLICVVERHAVYAPEHVLKAKVQFRVGF